MDLCPFCQSDDVEAEVDLDLGWCVFCNDCGATGPLAETNEKAVELWDKREEKE
jgi:Lar family restriction alleviation protein